MQASGGIGVFFGIESFGEESLVHANKRQNTVRRYRRAVQRLHARGICVMAGFIAGFDGDTPHTIVQMADNLHEIGVDVPFLSILTPFRGTPLHEELVAEGRMLATRGWEFYNGYNVTFRPRHMTPDQLLAAHRSLWCRAFSLSRSAGRLVRSLAHLRLGAALMAACMNGFYWLKQARGNRPRDAQRDQRHPSNSPGTVLVPPAQAAPGAYTGSSGPGE
jgi:hypothetical protein